MHKLLLLILFVASINTVYSQGNLVEEEDQKTWTEERDQILKSYQDEYAQKKNDPQFLKSYLEVLSIESDSKVIDKLQKQYLRKVSDLNSAESMDFVFENVYKDKSEFFKIVQSQKDAFVSRFGQERYDDKLLDVAYESALCRSCNNFVSHMMSKVRKKLEKYNSSIDEEELLIFFASKVFSHEHLYKKDIKRTNLAFKVLKDYSDQVESDLVAYMIANIANERDDFESLSLSSEALTKIKSKLEPQRSQELSSVINSKLYIAKKPSAHLLLAEELTIGDSLKWYTDFDEAILKAKEENKGVFVYATRARNQSDYYFQSKSVSDLIHNSFVPVALKDLPQRFTTKVTRYKYPYIIFYTSDKEEMFKSGQKDDRQALIDLIKFAKTHPAKRLKKFKSEYTLKKQDPDFVKRYLSFADSLGNINLVKDLTENFLKFKDEYEEEVWMDFVMIHVKEEDSKLFDLLIDHKPQFDEKYGEDIVSRILLKILIAEQLDGRKKVTVEKFIKRLLKKLESHELYLTDKFYMPFVAAVYDERREMFKNDEGEYAVRMLNQYSDFLDHKTKMRMFWDVAYLVNSTFQIEKAISYFNNLEEIKENFWELECKSILEYKIGNTEESERLIELNETFAAELNKEYRSELAYAKRKGYIK